MIALAFALACVQPAAPPPDIQELRRLCGWNELWPEAPTITRQVQLYRQHRQHLQNLRYVHGYQDGRWDDWIEQCEQAEHYWRLTLDALEAVGEWERQKMIALVELEGPFWGARRPPLLPEPPPPPVMPKCWPEPNAANP